MPKLLLGVWRACACLRFGRRRSCHRDNSTMIIGANDGCRCDDDRFHAGPACFSDVHGECGFHQHARRTLFDHADDKFAAVDFTSAVLSGLGGPYNLVEIDDDGTNEFWRLANPVTLGASQYTLAINGNNSGAGSLGGSITIRQANAVPEPATWAMMLIGFGAVGFAMRRRRAPVLAQVA